VATYIALINWTDQGIRDYKDTPARADAFATMLEGLGGKVRDLYWTIGAYDIVATVEAPDDETVTAAMLKVGSLGNIRTTTLRAFNRDELTAILAK
jgi:uncharacterized protein with GYD domain